MSLDEGASVVKIIKLATRMSSLKKVSDTSAPHSFQVFSNIKLESQTPSSINMAIRCLLPIISLLASSIASPLPITRRTDYPDEVVVLAECDNGQFGTALKIRDRLHYYSNDYDRRTGASGSQDTAMTITDPGQHDGFAYHVSWTSGTPSSPVSATFPDDGRTFKVWGLSSSGGEPDMPVTGTANFGGAEFKCYLGIPSTTWKTGDGMTCHAAYTCTRADRYIRATSVTFDDKIAQVGRSSASCADTTSPPLNAKDVFGQLSEMAAHSWDANNGIDIGGNCKMVFPTLQIPSPGTLPGYDSTTPEQIAKIFVDAVGAEIEKQRTKEERNCWIPGGPNGGGSTYHIVQEGVKYPHGGKFEIQMARQADPKSLQVQTKVEFRIDCSCESDNGLIAILQSSLGLVGWVSPAFGVTGASLGLYNAASC